MKASAALARSSPPWEYEDEVAVITAFGGTTALSQALGMSKSRISNWRVIGIPPQQFANLVALGVERRVWGITFEMLAELRRRREAILGRPSPFPRPPEAADK